MADRKKFSTLNKLVRVFLYYLKFLNNCRKNHSKKVLGNPLTPTETRSALNALIKINSEEFQADIQVLKSGKIIPKSSNLSK